MAKRPKGRLTESEQAFCTEVYQTYYERVYRRFLFLTGHRENAEDLAQEVVGVLFPEKLQAGEAPTALGPQMGQWFKEVMHYKFLDYLRKKYRHKEYLVYVSNDRLGGEAQESLPVAADDQGGENGRLDIIYLHKLVEKLPKKQGQVFKGIISGEPVPLLAQRLKLKAKSVEVYYCNAVNALSRTCGAFFCPAVLDICSHM